MLQLLTLLDRLAADVRASDDRGATAAEYGLLVTFIAVAILAAVVALGSKLGPVFYMAASAI